MLLDEVRRRNRRRIAVMAVVSILNHVVVVAVVVWWLIGRAFPWDLSLPGSLAVAVLIVVPYVWWELRRAPDATVADLGAEVLEPGRWPRLSNVVEEIAIATGGRPLRVAALNDPVPNALTVGGFGDRTILVVTTGLLERLRRDELEAVVAVQLCAVERLDVALQTVVVTCGGGAESIHEHFLEDWKDPRSWFLIATTWPSKAAASALRALTYRTCDFGADEMAVAALRHPDALRRALEKLLDDPGVVAAVTPANASLWFEPVPESSVHGAHAAADRETRVRRYSMTPSLEARIARLPHVETGATRRRPLSAG